MWKIMVEPDLPQLTI